MKKIFSLYLLFNIYSVQVNSQTVVSTYCGNGNPGMVNGSIDSATFREPFGMCTDGADIIFVADGSNNCIRKINISSGIVLTYAGTGVAGWKDGISDSAQFNDPTDLCIDDSGNVYVSDFMNQRIRKIDVNGMVTTIAGSGVAGLVNGSGVTAKFNYPRGIVIDHSGNIFVGDSWNHRIRKIDIAGNVSTFAGGGNVVGVGTVGALADGIDTMARFYTPSGLSIDLNDNIYVADAYNHRIRKITPSGVVTTVAGSGSSGSGNGGYADGNLSTSIFNTPTEVFADSLDVLYISDTFNNRIRKIDLNGQFVSTVAGNGNNGFVDGIDSIAEFNYPRGIVVQKNLGVNIYVADYNNNSIRLISESAVGVTQNETNKMISVFPVPSSNFIKVISTEDVLSFIEIINLSGKVLRKFENQSEKEERIDLSFLNSGLYILKVYLTNNKIIFKRVIKG